jgi:hypothetical protein
MQRVILLECNCTDSSLNSLFENASQCLTINELGCMSRLYGEELYKNDFVQRNCLSECPLECYFEQFDVSLSSIELIPNYYVDYLRSNANLYVDSNVDEERARKSFVSLNIFYKSLAYDLSLETPQTNSICLFASIGGYLSLFLGLSLFSVCELLQLVFELVLLRYF